MAHTDDDVRHQLWDMGMRLRNRLQVWVRHPSYEYKGDLTATTQRLLGAYDLADALGVTADAEQRAKLAQLAAHLISAPGTDLEYRLAALRYALAAYPLKED